MKAVLKEILETVAIALILFLVVQASLQRFEVVGSSMEPNLHNGQNLLVNKAVYFRIDLGPITKSILFVKERDQVVYLFHPPRRGEVMLFRPPISTDRDFIKRVIGLPGETVEIEEGRVYIDGKLLEEPYIKDPARYSLPPQQIPPDHYFVLGDNRNRSSDSHDWGLVPHQNLVGKAWLSLWPPQDWGLAPNYSPAW